MSRRHRSVNGRSAAAPRKKFSNASLILLGLILGLAGALYYAWVVAPVVYVDASPSRLSDEHKAEYIFLVSQSYAINEDWPLAQQRLAGLDDPAAVQTVTSLLETYVREQRPSDHIANLAVLARQLGGEAPVIALFAPTPLADEPPTATATITPPSPPAATPSPTPQPTITPRPTVTAVPTSIPDPTAQPTYRLLNQQQLCADDASTPQIEVVTLDALLEPLPGIEVLVTWDGGRDRFFTGFKPAQGEGYGDFAMTPDTSYTVTLADGSPEISGLRIESCDNGEISGWRLTFQNLILQPESPEP